MQEMPDTWIRTLGQEDPVGRKWQWTPIFLPGKFHGQRSLAVTDHWVAHNRTPLSMCAYTHTHTHTHTHILTLTTSSGLSLFTKCISRAFLRELCPSWLISVFLLNTYYVPWLTKATINDLKWWGSFCSESHYPTILLYTCLYITLSSTPQKCRKWGGDCVLICAPKRKVLAGVLDCLNRTAWYFGHCLHCAALCSAASVLSDSVLSLHYSTPGSSGDGILQQEYWSGLPCTPPGDLSDPGIECRSPAL